MMNGRTVVDAHRENKLKPNDLVGASFVAEACSADLKTVHNWVEKGRAPASFRTPGRHLRFKVADVAAWLAKHGYPIPEELRPLVRSAEEEHRVNMEALNKCGKDEPQDKLSGPRVVE